MKDTFDGDEEIPKFIAENPKRIIVTGADGYLGWPTMLYLASKGHTVLGFDNLDRRAWVQRSKSDTAIEIEHFRERNDYLQELFGTKAYIEFLELKNQWATSQRIGKFEPDVIINLASQPSAPYSMINNELALETQQNNNAITMNILWAIKERVSNCRLIHASTMGEYGQPNFPIPEHSLRVVHKSMSGVIPLGRQPLSFYHASNVLDTHNIFLACKNWGISAQVLMTAVVYGNNTFIYADVSRSATRFDFDKYFGTVINRFVAQSMISHNITVYGKGDQIRALISLEDFVESTVSAIDKNIPSNKDNPKFLVYNQVTEYSSINHLAELVIEIAKRHGSSSKLEHIKNPRTEKEEHFYEVETLKFDTLKTTRRPMAEHIEDMIEALNNEESKAILKKYEKSI